MSISVGTSNSPMLLGNSNQQQLQPAVGNTYRGIGADWFNAGNIAKEDFLRQQQSDLLAHQRDLEKLGIQNDFNASEAEKGREFESSEALKAYERQRELRRTAYQDTVEDLKAAGLNPLLALGQGANSSAMTPSASGSSASSGSGNSSRGSSVVGRVAQTSELISFAATLAKIGAGLYSSGQDRIAQKAISAASDLARKEIASMDEIERRTYDDKHKTIHTYRYKR